mmetsp:Transcript_89993/g.263056  ORF Transcript_89993/g.263056 Transcript_89993/m.263056 type:complete len:220 (-) Transcript_89993:520-1179(-)
MKEKSGAQPRSSGALPGRAISEMPPAAASPEGEQPRPGLLLCFPLSGTAVAATDVPKPRSRLAAPVCIAQEAGAERANAGSLAESSTTLPEGAAERANLRRDTCAAEGRPSWHRKPRDDSEGRVTAGGNHNGGHFLTVAVQPSIHTAEQYILWPSIDRNCAASGSCKKVGTRQAGTHQSSANLYRARKAMQRILTRYKSRGLRAPWQQDHKNSPCYLRQ